MDNRPTLNPRSSKPYPPAIRACNEQIAGSAKAWAAVTGFPIWVVLGIRVPFRVLFVRVPYDKWDPETDQNQENYADVQEF